MSVLVNRSTPGHAHFGLTRRTAAGAFLALAATASLIVLGQAPLTPAWLNWSANAVALATVLVVLMTALVGWQRMVTSALDDGVIGTGTDRDPHRLD